jgi:tetratricopeptide (TPR) repeat protein
MLRLLAKPQAAILAVLSFVLYPLPFAQALDPDLTTPYKVQVVLSVAPNRLLTPIFKEQLRRDLQRGLQGALGAMGEVEVIDLAEVKPEKQESLWKEVTAKGLQAGLDGPGKGTSAVKTHFVNVDYVDGQYEIQARQYDGLTGLASPSVRREQTPDRQFVARTAALLVDRDFGLVGTVTDGGDGQTVRVAFKGGGLKVPLDRWVKKGDVFALVQVGADGRTTRLPWAVLQADAAPGEDGTVGCKLYPPQQRPLGGAGTGYRCLKLGTVRGPVRLRVIEGGRKGPPRAPENVIIYIGRQGFTKNDNDGRSPDNDGFYSTEKEKDGTLFEGLAFVTVTQGGQVRAQVPLALVDDRTIKLPIKLGAEPPTFLINRSLWEQSLLNEQLTLAYLFPRLNEDIDKADRLGATVERARKALDGLNQRLPSYAEEREELAKAKPSQGAKPLDLSKGDARLRDLKQGRDELAEKFGRWEKILKEDKSPEAREAKGLYEKAHNLETEGDYGRAIELYKKVLATTKDAKLEQHLAKLKAAWEPKDDAHRKAQAFIYDTWPNLEAPAVMKDRVKQAQAALAVCRKVKDPSGPRKLLAVALLHSKKLTQDLEKLAPDLNEEDVKPAKELDEVLELLGKLIKEAITDVAQAPVP